MPDQQLVEAGRAGGEKHWSSRRGLPFVTPA